jgi:hypothetical protein
MAVKQAKTEGLNEFERVTRWRFDELLRLGLAPDQAIALIETPDIVHSVRKLAEQGCPSKIIVSLLGK